MSRFRPEAMAATKAPAATDDRADRKKCATPGCTIEFRVATECKDRAYCLVCDQIRSEAGVAAPPAPHTESMCDTCGEAIGSCARFSCPEQGPHQCYWCFVKQCVEARQAKQRAIVSTAPALTPTPPGGPTEQTEAKSTDHASMLPLFVKSLTGKTLSIVVPLNSLVYDMMCEIEKAQGTPINSYQLVFAGQLLHPHQPLSHYNLREESTVAITCDGWTSVATKGYLDITAQWLTVWKPPTPSTPGGPASAQPEPSKDAMSVDD